MVNKNVVADMLASDNVAEDDKDWGNALDDMRASKDQAYLERNHLVAALARLFPSGTKRTEIPGWDPEWQGCIYIDLPSGQISYHYHDSQAFLFEGLQPYKKPYDGHDKDEVHRRLAAIANPPGTKVL
jgi:hypothetical protein